ncbi:hypothetical protein [Pseudoclavibacter sp. JSM 162008]|uniref:hypothetical protein n=1 Tax=Pseudoclavibacter sp. JSM 162008 TaxID=3229855 RepID=UPI003526B1A3
MKSGWGQSVHAGVPVGATLQWGITVLSNQGWAEFVYRSPVQSLIFHTVRQQYYCHSGYGLGNLGGPSWDLEIRRVERTDPIAVYLSPAYIAGHQCNWDTPNMPW